MAKSLKSVPSPKSKKSTKAKKGEAIDWVEPYPPSQVETGKFQDPDHGGDAKQAILKDNSVLVRCTVNQELRLGKRVLPPGVHLITAAEAHAHASVLSAPPVQSEE